MKVANQLLGGLLLFAGLVAEAAPPVLNASRFGIASGAEWSGDYPKFEPAIREAGAGWLRYFREWHGMQPRKGEWDWQWADTFIAKSKSNGIQITGVFAYFAPWASSGNDSRTFPIRDMQDWRNYVSGMVARYGKDVPYWEIWNEPQAFQKNGKPKYYAEMVRAAFEAAKKTDPDVQLGLTTANFAVSYLNKVIGLGAADHFDYVCVHPYENVEQLTRPGGEVYFLSMAGNLRRMLAANKQRADMPLWITEIGWQTSTKPDSAKDELQAEILAKVYALAFAQGFERVFWFEARGPAYGKGTDHGIIRPDWSARPALTALKVMSGVLGPSPVYEGWVDLNGAYGFVFKAPGGPVLITWSPVGKGIPVAFEGPVIVKDIFGNDMKYAAKVDVELKNRPVYVTGLPAALVQQARNQKDKPFPWGGDYANAVEVTCDWAKGGSRGIELVSAQRTEPANTEGVQLVSKGGGASFRVHPSFAQFGTNELEVRVTARRASSDKEAGFQLMYESVNAEFGYDRAGWWTIPEGAEWQEHVYRLKDANFVGTWGYNLGMTEVTGDFLIKEVSVKRMTPPGR